MSVFYRVRVKVRIPTCKPQFIDGLYLSRTIAEDAEEAKRDISSQIAARFNAQNLPGAIVEVVLFRRSDIGFIISEQSEDHE